MKYRIKLTIFLISISLILSGCSTYKSPETSISKFISLIEKSKFSEAMDHIQDLEIIDAAPKVLTLFLQIFSKSEKLQLSSAGTYIYGQTEFTAVERDKKWLISNITHPELSVWFFLFHLENADFEKANTYILPELQDEMELVFTLLNTLSSKELKSVLVSEFNITGSEINGSDGIVYYSANGEQDKLEVYYDESRWYVLFPVENIWETNN